MSEENLQEIAFNLRIRFLETLKVIQNKHIKVQLVDNERVEADFVASDKYFSNLAVTDLKTPAFHYKKALLRTADIKKITCELKTTSEE